MADLVAGDTDSAIRATLRHMDGSPFDLTDLTPIIRFRANDAAPVEHDMVVIDAVNGIVQYTFLVGELVAGILYVEFEIRG